jgi:uncharacterized protein YbbC (DUF1343 family)
MRMSIVAIAFTLFSASIACKNNTSAIDVPVIMPKTTFVEEDTYFATDIITGAERTELYLPLIQDKYVACVVNQTSTIGDKHLVDSLIGAGVKIATIFAPEHGFRGTEDAGATILNSKDTKTGLPVLSLYGAKKKPGQQDLADAEIVIFDIQDVGARFYTYISTLHYVMEACAELNKPLIVLDRPNPNGFYVDGPLLQSAYTSFVGMHPIPVVHGMTIGEYAQMINGEKWLANGAQCKLTVIDCKNYDHTKKYAVPIAPSPNLKNMISIYLYPSLCFFEGTNVSVGRGTSTPFQIYGSPYIKDTGFNFTPKSGPGAKSPFLQNTVCYGFDLSNINMSSAASGQINLKIIIDMYQRFDDKGKFFLENNFFNKLAGSDELMKQIKAGLSEEEIRMSWSDDIAAFKITRKKYLRYPDFE